MKPKHESDSCILCSEKTKEMKDCDRVLHMLYMLLPIALLQITTLKKLKGKGLHKRDLKFPMTSTSGPLSEYLRSWGFGYIGKQMHKNHHHHHADFGKVLSSWGFE